MKKFLSGFLVGALIFSVIGVFAATYVASPVSFKVLVNGQEFISDPPPLEVEGRTYLPLRAMGEALGVPVNWNESLNQAEVGTTSTPTQPSDNYSRQNPAPLNTVQQINVESFMGNYSAAVKVISTIRGDAAYKMIMDENQFNQAPEDGYEYVIANIALSILSVEDDKSHNINMFDFKVYTSNNEECSLPSVVEPSPELDGTLFAGGNKTGNLVFQVRKDDSSPKVVYGMKYDGSGGIWFSLQ